MGKVKAQIELETLKAKFGKKERPEGIYRPAHSNPRAGSKAWWRQEKTLQAWRDSEGR